jgi:hypothetical protein
MDETHKVSQQQLDQMSNMSVMLPWRSQINQSHVYAMPHWLRSLFMQATLLHMCTAHACASSSGKKHTAPAGGCAAAYCISQNGGTRMARNIQRAGLGRWVKPDSISWSKLQEGFQEGLSSAY